jgi:hypothetical protein
MLSSMRSTRRLPRLANSERNRLIRYISQLENPVSMPDELQREKMSIEVGNLLDAE